MLAAMRTFISILVAASLAVLLSACATTGSPRKDATSKTGYYIPRDLDDALVELDRIMGTKGHEEVIRATEDGMIEYHHGLGTWLRNNWGLWGGSRLSEYFHQLGIRHPDDMSGIIFDSYWRKLHDRPIDLEGQVRYYQDYWKSQKTNEGG
jgi:hypothetical protein